MRARRLASSGWPPCKTSRGGGPGGARFFFSFRARSPRESCWWSWSRLLWSGLRKNGRLKGELYTWGRASSTRCGGRGDAHNGRYQEWTLWFRSQSNRDAVLKMFYVSCQRNRFVLFNLQTSNVDYGIWKSSFFYLFVKKQQQIRKPSLLNFSYVKRTSRTRNTNFQIRTTSTY